MSKNVLSIDLSYRDALAVVTVAGEVDTASAPSLRLALDQLEPDKHAYVDMADVGFLDSKGVNVLIHQALRMRRSHAELHIQNPSRVVRRVIEISGLSGQFFEFDSVGQRTQD
ncbi:MAG: anti-sigma factor antagonist [Ilumatobacteraceae bacterium]|jgi:stage II sporulation protein AA (anti-sigma F factor antagonist)